jgi:hypothetical protein
VAMFPGDEDAVVPNRKHPNENDQKIWISNQMKCRTEEIADHHLLVGQFADPECTSANYFNVCVLHLTCFYISAQRRSRL